MSKVWQPTARRPGARQILGAALILALASCGGGSEDDAARASIQGGISGSGRMGTLALALADAPACGFDAVYITVSKLRFNQNAATSGAGGGWIDVSLPTPVKVDLLTLTNGTTMSLGAFGVPAGTYAQMRVLLVANDAAHPLANSVVPTGGVESPLATPSAQQSGIKVDASMTVPAGGVGSYVMDLDACQSVVAGGQPAHYTLNPVIQVIPDDASATTTGTSR